MVGYGASWSEGGLSGHYGHITTDRPKFESVLGLLRSASGFVCVLGAKAWAQCRDWYKNKLTWNMLSRKNRNAIVYVFVIREAPCEY